MNLGAYPLLSFCFYYVYILSFATPQNIISFLSTLLSPQNFLISFKHFSTLYEPIVLNRCIFFNWIYAVLIAFSIKAFGGSFSSSYFQSIQSEILFFFHSVSTFLLTLCLVYPSHCLLCFCSLFILFTSHLVYLLPSLPFPLFIPSSIFSGNCLNLCTCLYGKQNVYYFLLKLSIVNLYCAIILEVFSDKKDGTQFKVGKKKRKTI